MPDKEAILIRKLKKWRGNACLYRLNPPFESDHNFRPWNSTEEEEVYEYIIVSSVQAKHFYKSETMIFASTKSGKAPDDAHAFRTSKLKNHEKVLEQIGYTLVSAPPKVKKVAEVKQTRYLRLDD